MINDSCIVITVITCMALSDMLQFMIHMYCSLSGGIHNFRTQLHDQKLGNSVGKD